jgi:pimeloyl-ACP methyl ester carboxylesterase
MALENDRKRFARVKLAGGPALQCTLQCGGGAPVLLLHGYSDSAGAWAPVLPHLPEAWNVAAPDQRGHGRSERPASGYTMAAFAADAARLVDALGWERATVVGHSMGGMIAQRFAIDFPERVARLVLVGTTPVCAGPAVDELVAAVLAFGEEVPRDFVEAFQAGTVARPLAPEFAAAVVDASCAMPARVWRAIAAELAGLDLREELPRIAAPTHVVWGDADAFFGAPEQEALRKGIPGATFSVYAGAGHSPHWEEPERFARELAELVAGASSKAPARAARGS